MRPFNINFYGAVGNGTTDDTDAVNQAIREAVAAGGALLVPAGQYRITRALEFPDCDRPLSMLGHGANVAAFLFDGVPGFSFGFRQAGARQPNGLTMHEIGLRARGRAGTALSIDYGTPEVTNDHNRPSVSIANCAIESGEDGSFDNGIDIRGAWNPTLHNVFISGDSCGGDWNQMRGAGVRLRGMCVNAHLSNVRTNFWADGLVAVAGSGPNTEGIFCSNCSMVAVKRGVYIAGNPRWPGVPRISTFTWNGGLIEARVKGVEGLPCGIHLADVWTALIANCQLLTDTIAETAGTTFGILQQTCRGVIVVGCDINAWHHGVHTTGETVGAIVRSNSFTNTREQVVFAQGARDCVSGGNRVIDGTPFEWTDSTNRNCLVYQP